jgi:hypothetical protein
VAVAFNRKEVLMTLRETIVMFEWTLMKKDNFFYLKAQAYAKLR